MWNIFCYSFYSISFLLKTVSISFFITDALFKNLSETTSVSSPNVLSLSELFNFKYRCNNFRLCERCNLLRLHTYKNISMFNCVVVEQ